MRYTAASMTFAAIRVLVRLLVLFNKDIADTYVSSLPFTLREPRIESPGPIT